MASWTAKRVKKNSFTFVLCNVILFVQLILFKYKLFLKLFPRHSIRFISFIGPILNQLEQAVQCNAKIILYNIDWFEIFIISNFRFLYSFYILIKKLVWIFILGHVSFKETKNINNSTCSDNQKSQEFNKKSNVDSSYDLNSLMGRMRSHCVV